MLEGAGVILCLRKALLQPADHGADEQLRKFFKGIDLKGFCNSVKRDRRCSFVYAARPFADIDHPRAERAPSFVNTHRSCAPLVLEEGGSNALWRACNPGLR